jgi:hypothetical protein
MKKESRALESAFAEPTTPKERTDLGFDLEGLMSDFPTATELQKFIYDQTGVVLNLKGRSNKVKYQIALDVLNGSAPPAAVLGSENPYVDKNDIVPCDPLKELPPQPAEIFGHKPVTQFQCDVFPHPDPEWSAMGQKCSVIFRKYIDNTITYEVIGPIAQRAIGMRVNKYGQNVPERYTWVDPRTGEQVIQTAAGRITAIGTRLKNFMSKMKVGNKTQWETWIDREFVIGGNPSAALDNPWNI